MKVETDFDWRPRISLDAGVAAGHAVITGTRVPVEVIVGNLAGGDTMEAICEAYRIAPEDVRAALAYAAELVAKKRVRALPRR